MPLKLPKGLPAIEILEKENIFISDSEQASLQDIRTLRIVVLNLMPTKITTETDLVRLLSNSPLHIELTFMKLATHTPKNTPIEHMNMFYKDFDILKNERFDGMIITGAPVELMEFEEVRYWRELQEIFNWSKTNVTSTLYICWAAQAGLYHFYGVPKYQLSEKMFGIFPHKVDYKKSILFRGFDDTFMVPHSRHTTVLAEDIIVACGGSVKKREKQNTKQARKFKDLPRFLPETTLFMFPTVSAFTTASTKSKFREL